MTPGIPTKLNIPKVTSGGSPKAAIASNLSGAKRATGASYGIFAQRSMLGSGVQYNNFLYNGNGIAETRRALNASRPRLFNNVSPHNCNNNQDNTMNKFMMGMMALNMLSQTTAGVVDTVKSMKGNDTNVSSPRNNNANSVTAGYEYGQIPQGPMERGLNGANTFNGENGIKALQTKATDTVEKFQENYSKEASTTKQSIDGKLEAPDVKGGLQAAGVTIDTSKIKVSNLGIDTAKLDPDVAGGLDLSSIDKAMGQIDKDIEALQAFINTDLTDAVSELSTKSGILDGEIQNDTRSLESLQAKLTAGKDENGVDLTPAARGALQEQINNLQRQIESKTTQKRNIDKAKEQLQANGEVRQAVQGLIDGVKAKRTELADAKKTLEQVATKKYELAKKHDGDIKNYKTKMDAIERNLDQLKSRLSSIANDSSKAQEAESIKSQINLKVNTYNGFATIVLATFTSLEAAGWPNTKTFGASGKTYTVTVTTQDKDNYTKQLNENDYLGTTQAQQGANPQGTTPAGAGPIVGNSITVTDSAMLEHLPTGSTIVVNGQEYKVLPDNKFEVYPSASGSQPISKEALIEMMPQTQPLSLGNFTIPRVEE